MSNKFLVISIIINIILVIFIIKFLSFTNTSIKDNSIGINNNTGKVLNYKKSESEKTLKEIKQDIASKKSESEKTLKLSLSQSKENMCNNIILGKDNVSDLGKRYIIYKNIENNKEAKKDYGIMNNIFIKRNCDFFKNGDKYDYDMCNIISNNNIKEIDNKNMPKSDKLFSLSYLSNVNKCGDDKDCNFYLNFLNKLKTKNLPFPNNINTSRYVEFYAYKKIFSSIYNSELDKLFLSECMKPIGKLKK